MQIKDNRPWCIRYMLWIKDKEFCWHTVAPKVDFPALFLAPGFCVLHTTQILLKFNFECRIYWSYTIPHRSSIDLSNSFDDPAYFVPLYFFTLASINSCCIINFFKIIYLFYHQGSTTVSRFRGFGPLWRHSCTRGCYNVLQWPGR